jgi:hypothetical protein
MFAYRPLRKELRFDMFIGRQPSLDSFEAANASFFLVNFCSSALAMTSSGLTANCSFTSSQDSSDESQESSILVQTSGASP